MIDLLCRGQAGDGSGLFVLCIVHTEQDEVRYQAHFGFSMSL